MEKELRTLLWHFALLCGLGNFCYGDVQGMK